jgi:hypothetical protein
MANVKRVATAAASHSFSEEEKESFVEHINQALGHDPQLQGRLPINPSDNSLFTACADGVILWCAFCLFCEEWPLSKDSILPAS